MKETYNIAAAVEAQKEYCKEYAARHPQNWAAKLMSEGKGFAPVGGRCWCCRQKNARHNHAHRRGAPEEEVFIIKLGERV